jgi:branched-chain amino acid transport system ATP-binding protein
VLLDEPAAGMIGNEIEKTAGLIRRINERCAIVVVEHDMDFIIMIAKKVTVFNRGRVLVEDSVDKVMTDERVREVYLGKRAGGTRQ